MNYETQPTNRFELRLFSHLFRSICGYSIDEPINLVELLERLPDFEGFNDVFTEIVDDKELPAKVMHFVFIANKQVHTELLSS